VQRRHPVASGNPYEPMVLVSDKPMNIIVLVGLIVMVRHFLHAGRKCATLPGTEESMTTTIEFITALFWTSGRIQTERYGFTLHEPNFDFLNGFAGRFIAHKSP
jgi:hypothetical protein